MVDLRRSNAEGVTNISKFPSEIGPDMRHAIRLEWWTIAWQGSIVAVMFLVMGSSQAMKSAWLEDMSGIMPAVVFLVAVHFERKAPLTSAFHLDTVE